MPDFEKMVDVIPSNDTTAIQTASSGPDWGAMKDPAPEKPKRPSVISQLAMAYSRLTPVGQLRIAADALPEAKEKEGETTDQYLKRMGEAENTAARKIEEKGVGEVLRPQFDLGIAAGAVKAPIMTAKYLGGFTALDKFVNFRRYIDKHFPNTWPEVKDIAEIADFTAKGAAIGGGDWAIKKTITMKMLNDLKLPTSFHLTPDHMMDVDTHPDLTDADRKSFYDTLGIEDIHKKLATSADININIPADKMLDLAKQPFWDKVKDIFQKPEEPSDTKINANEGFVKKAIGEGKKWGQATADTFRYIKTGWSNLANSYWPVYQKFGGKATSGPLEAIFLKAKARLGFDNAKSETYDKTFNDLEAQFGKFSEQDLDNLMLCRGTGTSPEALAIQKEAFDKLPDELKDPNIQRAHTEATDYVYKYLTDNGLDINYVEDYIRGSYKFKDKYGSKRFQEYWMSSDAFTKQKQFPTYADAKAFDPTCKLRDVNPIKNARSELMMGAQRVGMLKLRESLLSTPTGETPKEGGGIEVKEGEKAQPGADLKGETASYAVMTDKATMKQRASWDRINDPVFKDMLFEPSYARFVNNLIETNKVEQGGLLKGLRTTAKAAQVTKFALSTFHLKNIVKTALADEALGILDPQGYRKLVEAVQSVDRTSKEYAEYVGLTGGHEYAAEVQAQQAVTNWIDKISKGKIEDLGTTLGKVYKQSKWIPATPEFIRWQFEKFIPDVKFIKWQYECAEQSERLGRPLENFEKQDIARNLQNFYGEMNEQLFGRSATVTSALRIIFSAPGYGEGNFRALFGSMKEIKDVVATNAQKLMGKDVEAQKLSPKNMRFIMNSFVNTLILSTVGTRIMTGQWPDAPKTGEDIRDLFKIKTPFKDGNGDTIYYDMMDYANDFYSVYGMIATGQGERIPKGLGQRVTGAESAVFKGLTDVADLCAGKVIYDYKGNPVYQRNDPFEVKFGKLLAHWGTSAKPISLSTFQKTKEEGTPTGVSVGMAQAGFKTTTSERVKTLKDIRQDIFASQHAKQEADSSLSKIYNQNPEEGQKQIDTFNTQQMKNLKVIIGRMEKEGISKDEIIHAMGGNLKAIKNRYFITSVKQKKDGAGTDEAIVDLFRKRPRQRRQQLPEEKRKIDEIMKDL